jgi:hypothetical protein
MRLFLLLWICMIPFLMSVIDCSDSSRKPPCHSSEIEFFGKCFCKPGFYRAGDNKDSNTCSEPLLTIGDCDCHSEIKDTIERNKFLLDQKWWHKQGGYRCTALCRYSNELGVITSIETEWHENQVWRQLPHYKQELTQTSTDSESKTHMRIRLNEFGEGFNQFYVLNNTNLGNVIEYGAGGYTQIRNILERTNANMESITLLDPQIYDYQKIPSSSYSNNGQLYIPSRSKQTNGGIYPTTLYNTTVENFGKINENIEKYDTVIMMNVLVYAKNALDFLKTLHKTLKVGGTLIFHDRWFNDPVNSSHCKFAGFAMHIIQVRESLLKHYFNSSFTIKPFISTKQTEGQIERSKNWCKWKDDEMGFWAIITKIK